MGIWSSKNKKDMDSLFGREKWKEQRREEKRKKAINSNLKRKGLKEPPVVGPSAPPITPPGVGTPQIQFSPRSYDEEALERMRHQLNNDADAFLLNNILLSVQFFENYEREAYHIKSVPIAEHEHRMSEEMVLHHKHVFFADRLQECVQEHVRFARRKGCLESLVAPRLFVIYDNVEACEPGDTSDYSAVLDAPFYKLQIENSKEPGYVKLKKLEVLQSAVNNKEENISNNPELTPSSRSSETDSERESNDSEEFAYTGKGQALLDKIKNRLKKSPSNIFTKSDDMVTEESFSDVQGRRSSGPIKYIKPLAAKGNISNVRKLRKTIVPQNEESEKKINTDLPSPVPDKKDVYDFDIRPRKSVLKNGNITKLSGPSRELKYDLQFNTTQKAHSDSGLADDTETTGSRSTSSSRHNESSETESDYGYSTITGISTPKPVEVSVQSNMSSSSGVLPDECWTAIEVKATSQWSDDEEDEGVSEVGPTRDSTLSTLYETYFYLTSTSFMTNFVDNFVIKLGAGLGISPNAISSALTQGASIYCNSIKNEVNSGYEVIPALIASWPNIANQWIIRERRIIQNPRTNFSYQWPTKYMVSRTADLGCMLIPFGFRPKRGPNSDQKLQWKIIFPAAERYLESRLAHSHIRCYLFTLALHKTFMENETAKIGIDASHIKNHLFWQCEDNYAKWPEDRLGETLGLFLRSFYSHFSQSRFPNYFVETCNDFKGIPKPVLLKAQRRLADILEAPVMHVLGALQKLKYTSKDFYPRFDYYQLYHILTCRNPLRILNPNLPPPPTNYSSSDSDDDRTNSNTLGFWDQAKDKQYMWKKAKQRQSQEVQRKKAAAQVKKQITTAVSEKLIERNIILPKKMEAERRRLVLEFFIPHFIGMARASDKFEATKQAIIYLEQAQRLCMLLLEEPSGETIANDFLDTIRERLAEYQRKLVHQGGYKLLSKRDSRQVPEMKLGMPPDLLRRQRLKSLNTMVGQNSPTDTTGVPAFTFVDVHNEPSTSGTTKNFINLTHNHGSESDEESKL